MSTNLYYFLAGKTLEVVPSFYLTNIRRFVSMLNYFTTYLLCGIYNFQLVTYNQVCNLLLI